MRQKLGPDLAEHVDAQIIVGEFAVVGLIVFNESLLGRQDLVHDGQRLIRASGLQEVPGQHGG